MPRLSFVRRRGICSHYKLFCAFLNPLPKGGDFPDAAVVKAAASVFSATVRMLPASNLTPGAEIPCSIGGRPAARRGNARKSAGVDRFLVASIGRERPTRVHLKKPSTDSGASRHAGAAEGGRRSRRPRFPVPTAARHEHPGGLTRQTPCCAIYCRPSPPRSWPQKNPCAAPAGSRTDVSDDSRVSRGRQRYARSSASVSAFILAWSYAFRSPLRTPGRMMLA